MWHVVFIRTACVLFLSLLALGILCFVLLQFYSTRMLVQPGAGRSLKILFIMIILVLTIVVVVVVVVVLLLLLLLIILTMILVLIILHNDYSMRKFVRPGAGRAPGPLSGSVSVSSTGSVSRCSTRVAAVVFVVVSGRRDLQSKVGLNHNICT